MQILLEYKEHIKTHHQIDESILLDEIRKDLVVYGKDNNRLKLQFYSGKDFYDREDITGWTFDLIVKVNPDDADTLAVMRRHVTTISDPIDGIVYISLTFQSGEFLEGNYIYQLKRTNNSGRVQLLNEGLICFRQSLFGEV